MKRLLILGGTGDAANLASKTDELKHITTIYSLAGRTRKPHIPKCEIRIGGFGGTDGLTKYLKINEIDFVIDATHPFANKMAKHAARACTRLDIPRVKFCRPAWISDKIPWISSSNYTETAHKINKMGNRIFLSIGTNGLDAFSFLTEKWFLIRAVDRPKRPIPLVNHNIILNRGPFEEVNERQLLINFNIEVLVCKNSGGSPAAKLKAANDLGIPIVMIEKPLPPEGTEVCSIQETLDWLSIEISR